MTSYHGGKQRIGQKLAQVIYDESMDISEEEGFQIKGYCEPFSGMLGVYKYIPELFKDQKPELEYKAGDINKSVIMMWKAVQQGWKPPLKCTKEQFFEIKNNGKSSAEKGYIGHLFSFRSIYFGGYANHITPSRMIKTSTRVQDIATELNKVKFSSGSYKQFSELKDYVIYCDPPYLETRQCYVDEYGKLFGFDTQEFLTWCREMSKNNLVFVSDYSEIPNSKLLYTNKKENLYLVQSHPNNPVDLLHQN
jgi:site-specific DNA-adenine methylase